MLTSPTEVLAAAGKGDYTLEVTAPDSWQAYSNDSWITDVSPSWSSSPKGTVTFKVAENLTAEGREGAVVIKCGSVRHSVKVTQPSASSEDGISCPLDGYRLVWHDEFDDESSFSTDWKFENWRKGYVNNELQRYAIEHSRFGIPLLLAEEAPHGHMAIGTTVFPTGIGLASTWDTGLVRETGRAIGEELRAQGSYAGFGPVIDLARDPRWSRVEETFGEDVYLSSMMGAAMAASTGLSTLKHFIAYGIPEGGHNGSQSVVGERDLRENFLPAFKAAIDSGAVSVMTSYNTIDGVPSTCNPRLLRDILKGEWEFGGFVVSD